MKFISYLDNNVTSLGYLLDFDNRVVNISKISNNALPDNMKNYLINFEFVYKHLSLNF